MPSNDLIRSTLARPMEWQQFEQLIYEILLQDDFPSLKQMGGGNDQGIDSVETMFYRDTSQTHRIVQVTSQRAQKAKFTQTLKKLLKTQEGFEQIVIVYRHPVSAAVKRDIQASAREQHVSVDVRDESYIVGQLGKPQCRLFSRFFQDAGTQLRALLDKGDPLLEASDRLRHAMLASLGAYLLNPGARLVRNTFFDRTVLAVIAAGEGGSTFSCLHDTVSGLMPNETIDEARLRGALTRLEKAGLCKVRGTNVVAGQSAVESIASMLVTIQNSFDGMFDKILTDVTSMGRLDDATKGRLERNLKQTLLAILRLLGPVEGTDSDVVDDTVAAEGYVVESMSRELRQDIARIALASLNEYVKATENREYLGTLARSYAAIALRNMDPLGRQWQKQRLSRAVIVLDTDVVLKLMIRELPAHSAVLDSLNALSKDGTRIVVSQFVLDEVVIHVSRADKSFAWVRGKLHLMSSDQVEAGVSHAVVRGYYYYSGKGYRQRFDEYWHDYYEESDPEQYVIQTLKLRLPALSIREQFDLSETDVADMEIIAADMLARKEPKRAKAAFRMEKEKEDRVRSDVRIALYSARLGEQQAQFRANGYVISTDGAFQMMQKHDAWGKRPRMHIHTQMIPTLAEMVCGIRLPDDLIVSIVFNPLHIAAADMMKDDLAPLIKVGVSLRNKGLDRLEWDIRNHLEGLILDYKRACGDETVSEDKRLLLAVDLASGASDLGYDVHPDMEPVIRNYRQAARKAKEEELRRLNAEELLKRLVDGATGLTKKGRRRVNRILREAGGLPEHDDNDA